MRLLVYQPDVLLADALQTALESDDVQVIVAGRVDEVVEASRDVDVCVVDARSAPGLDVVGELSALPGGPQVVGLIDTGDRPQLTAVLDAGAVGWVTTADGLDRLARAVRGGQQGLNRPRVAIEHAVRGDRAWRGSRLLTDRETEVLAGLADGASTKALAARLRVSQATVRSHIHSVLAKLDAHSRLEAVAYALDQQLIDVAAWRSDKGDAGSPSEV